MNNASPIDIENIRKSYNGRTVLDGITLTQQPGEILGLVGLNGAGKTTLIKILLDLIVADGGQARLFGHAATQVAARKNLSYLPEKFQPSRYLQGYEFIDLAMSHFGRKLDREQAREMAVTLDLDPLALTRRIGTYSKGMGQKLGLASAFLVDTPLLLLDEPMSGLDPKARIALKNALLKAKTAGKSVFFSSHILSDMDEICDRIAILHEGSLRFTGTPAAFKAQQGESSLERAFLGLIETGPPGLLRA